MNNNDIYKQKLKSWDFTDSSVWKKQNCASKSQRQLIKRMARSFKRSAKQFYDKEIENETKNLGGLKQMKTIIIIDKNVTCHDTVKQILNEDLLFTSNINASLKAFNGEIEKIVNEGDTQTIYIKAINDNLLLG